MNRTNFDNALLTGAAILIGTALALTLTGCSGPSAGLPSDAANPAAQPVPAAGASLPSLPVGETGVPNRSASAVVSVPGAGALQSFNAAAVDTTLVLTSSETELAWALYKIEGLAGRKVESLSVSALPGALGRTYSVGVSNFSAGVWDFLSSTALPEFEFNLSGDMARRVSQLGNLYFIVVASGGASVAVENAGAITRDELPGELLPGLPLGLSASQGLADSVELSWTAAEGADIYMVYRRGYTLSAEGEQDHDGWAQLDSTTATSYVDATVEIDKLYEYKLKAKSAAGEGGVAVTAFGWAGTAAFTPGVAGDDNGGQGEDEAGDDNGGQGEDEAGDDNGGQDR